MSITLCGSLVSENISPSCDNPILTGIESVGIILNRDDVDFANVVKNGTRKNVIEDLAVKVGKKGYSIYIPSNTPFNGTKITMATGVNSNKFNSEVAFTVLNNDPDVTANIIDGLANGTYVVVIQNKYNNTDKASTPSDSVFQVFGFEKGLRATAIENDKYSADTDGGWSVVLTEELHPKAGHFLYNTDYATTLAQFEALTNVATS